MSLRISSKELCSVVGGEISPAHQGVISIGVEFSSGEVKGGELFVALKGESTHGHNYLRDAFSRGASMALVEDRALLSDSEIGSRLIYVADTLKAFSSLAHWWRETLAVPVAAVTGSVGKTTTKEMMAAILLQESRGVYSLKSHNNHTGVPYTILRGSKDHHWMVLEMGMNHPGELAPLSAIGSPDLCIVTCVAPAHIGYMGSLSNIAKEKLSIAAGLRPNGKFLVNGDDPAILAQLELDRASLPQEIFYFGNRPESVASLKKVESRGFDGIAVDLVLRRNGIQEDLHAEMSVVGRHNTTNILAAVAGVALLLPDISRDKIVKGLESFRAPLMRMNLKEYGEGKKIVDDSYNANPTSMKGLLELGIDLKAQGSKIGCVFGDMFELGEHSLAYHREVAQEIVRLAPQFLVGVGEMAKEYVAIAKSHGLSAIHADNSEVAAHIVRKLDFDILLVKGSRGVGLDKTVRLLTSE